MLKIEVVKNADLVEPDHAAIIDLCSRAFEEDYAPYLATFVDPVFVLAWLDGKLVSHALWITRWLEVDGEMLLRTAYVEGVATEEIYRGRGFATGVMQRVAGEISSFEIGALSPAETTLYSRLGWEFWQGPLFHRKEGRLIADPPDEAVMILRLPGTPALDLSRPLSIEWREGEVW